ncbi:outer membrane protein assembly factor BamB family protein [Microbacterium lacticum]
MSEVFGAAEWSAHVRKGSTPLVLGDFVVAVADSGVTGLDADGREQWHTAIEPLPDTARPDGVRDLIAVTPEVVAAIDTGMLPKGSDPLASDVVGTRVTLLNVADGSEIAEQSIPGDQVTRTAGLAFEIAGNDSEYVAFSPTGEKIVAEDGKLPVATVGEHVVWGVPYTANMGAQTMQVVGLPLEGANLGASDGRNIVVLNSYDGKTTTTLWVNLATGQPLALDASCPPTLMPKTLTPSPDGGFVVGDNAVADIENGTITCTGGGDGQGAVLWRAVTDQGVAYGQTADASDTFVIGRDGDTETFPIPSNAAHTLLLGITSDSTAILYDRDTGIINANPVRA